MTEHSAKIVLGLIVVALGSGMVAVGAELGMVGAFVNLVGGAILVIGVIGAGVEAGTRKIVAELRRPSEHPREDAAGA